MNQIQSQSEKDRTRVNRLTKSLPKSAQKKVNKKAAKRSEPKSVILYNIPSAMKEIKQADGLDLVPENEMDGFKTNLGSQLFQTVPGFPKGAIKKIMSFKTKTTPAESKVPPQSSYMTEEEINRVAKDDQLLYNTARNLGMDITECAFKTRSGKTKVTNWLKKYQAAQAAQAAASLVPGAFPLIGSQDNVWEENHDDSDTDTIVDENQSDGATEIIENPAITETNEDPIVPIEQHPFGNPASSQTDAMQIGVFGTEKDQRPIPVNMTMNMGSSGFGNYANLTPSFQSLSETANAADILNINGSAGTNINNSPYHMASFDSTQAQNDPPNDPAQTTQSEPHQPTQTTGQKTVENMKASINHLK
ncbi:unnamed protein product [Ambrosiozyma monospora]|uniref:Unnamed protein product n=1 Tax=Ambrosiozyma monospora TaxID=43982 RepID=A0A9W7DDR9_AMBMO|nr:unnamed protein product [Ambrosiozyma monospora]